MFTREVTNVLKPEQYGQYFADNIFKYDFVNLYLCTLSHISLNDVANWAINNKSTLVLAWHQAGDSPSPEAMVS